MNTTASTLYLNKNKEKITISIASVDKALEDKLADISAFGNSKKVARINLRSQDFVNKDECIPFVVSKNSKATEDQIKEGGKNQAPWRSEISFDKHYAAWEVFSDVPEGFHTLSYTMPTSLNKIASAIIVPIAAHNKPTEIPGDSKLTQLVNVSEKVSENELGNPDLLVGFKNSMTCFVRFGVDANLSGRSFYIDTDKSDLLLVEGNIGRISKTVGKSGLLSFGFYQSGLSHVNTSFQERVPVSHEAINGKKVIRYHDLLNKISINSIDEVEVDTLPEDVLENGIEAIKKSHMHAVNVAKKAQAKINRKRQLSVDAG